MMLAFVFFILSYPIGIFSAYNLGKLHTQKRLLEGLRNLNNRTPGLYSHLQEGHLNAVGQMIDLIQ